MTKLTEMLDEIGVGKILIGLLGAVIVLLGTIWWDFNGEVAELKADLEKRLDKLESLSGKTAEAVSTAREAILHEMATTRDEVMGKIAATREEVKETSTLVRYMSSRQYPPYQLVVPDPAATTRNGTAGPVAPMVTTSTPP